MVERIEKTVKGSKQILKERKEILKRSKNRNTTGKVEKLLEHFKKKVAREKANLV